MQQREMHEVVAHRAHKPLRRIGIGSTVEVKLRGAPGRRWGAWGRVYLTRWVGMGDCRQLRGVGAERNGTTLRTAPEFVANASANGFSARVKSLGGGRLGTHSMRSSTGRYSLRRASSKSARTNARIASRSVVGLLMSYSFDDRLKLLGPDGVMIATAFVTRYTGRR